LRTEVNRLAVGDCASETAGRDGSIRASDVFDDDWLSKRLSHLLGKYPCDRIYLSARRDWHDYRDGAGWVRLCPRDPRNCWQRGGTCRQA
jgi:hypothetical protein